MPFGLIAPTNILRYTDVASWNEVSCPRLRRFLSIWRALQDHRKLPFQRLPVLGWTVDVARQFHTIAHGNHHVVINGNLVLRLRSGLGERSRSVNKQDEEASL